MPKLTAKGSKAKGDKFERDLAAEFSKSTGLYCQRAPLSGGGALGILAGGGADILGTPGLHIEAKRC